MGQTIRITFRALVRGLLGPVVLAALVLSPPIDAAQSLPRQDPDEVGADADALESAFSNAGELRNIRSLVVVRSGSVIQERYWVGDESYLHHVRSVTKSVTSTLIGIAIDRGFISDVDARIVDYLPARYLPLSADKHSITVRHLLTMTSGLAWDENDDWVAWTTSFDPVQFILSRPLETPPGSRFNYSTAASHILSAILREATGVDVLDFAQAELFNPLGFPRVLWQTDPRGYRFGGHGLQLRTEDSAKLGMLMLKGGIWDQQRLLTPSWIQQATNPQVELGASYGPFSALHYGHLWWLDRSLEHDSYWAWGWGGQFVFCIPALQLVVAANHYYNVPYTQANGQEQAMLRLIVNQIIPAVTGEDPHRRLPEGRGSSASSPLAGTFLWSLRP